MKRTSYPLAAVVFTLIFAPGLLAQDDSTPRMPSGRPDLSGNYNAATLTPLVRPPQFGDKATLTPEEAKDIAKREQDLQLKGAEKSVIDEAPPEGGAKVVGLEETAGGGNEFGAGNVGAYNLFWMDRGDDVNIIDGKIPTSILVDPTNGRLPAMTPDARKEQMAQLAGFRPNDGTAWWAKEGGAGPYDGPESLPLRERCVLGFTGVAPTLPALYNNFKRIVQSEDHVMILLEMVHDARIVRLNSEHPGPEERRWLGDSIGWWEDDTLIVDTTNFRAQKDFRGGNSEDKHVVERFTVLPGGDLLYRFTVKDPAVWTEPWTGQYLWRASDDKVYEYACHEGNYAMTNVLKGARLLESEAASQ